MRRIVVIAICAAFLGTVASAQNPTPATPPAIFAEYNPTTNLPMQPIGPEDLVALSVYDSPEFSRTVRVAADGTIRLPMLKSTIHIQGLMPSEAEKAVAEALKNENLLNDPFVTMSVAEYHSRPVNVMGAVRSPVIFQAMGDMTLLDALARAGGLLDSAGPIVVVTKRNSSSDEKTVQTIRVRPLLEGSTPELNLKLTGGEEIRVPPVETIIVQGNVTKPGVYPVLEPLTNNTVTSALAQAGGVAQYAEHTAYIYRVDAKGVRQTITVPLWDILRRKKPDMVMQARDTLYVPDSPKRRITQEAVTTATGMGTSITTGVIIASRP